MKILFLTETHSGCWKWRGKIPAKYLRRLGHDVQVYEHGKANYDAPDVIVFFRTTFVRVNEILDWCKSRQIKIVFDTDDALDLVPNSNPCKIWNPAEERNCIAEYHDLARAADLVTTTTPLLAQHLRSLNPNVTVLPNSVDPEEWPERPFAERRDVPRIGWTGGSTHFNDLGMIADAIRAAQKKQPFDFIVQGLCTEENPGECYNANARAYRRAFTESQFGKSMKWFVDRMQGIRGEFHPSVPVDEHAGDICSLGLNVGLAPLQEGTFNQFKSCIKFYEYCMAGAATIASRVMPYSAEVPTLVRNTTAAWTEALIEAAGANHAEAAHEQREWVLEHRNIQRNVSLWEQAYLGDQISSEPVEELAAASAGC